MRLYAFLLFALFAIAARAATIPENVSEKKISVVPENTEKAQENVSSEQELIDQSNTINDVDNQLRTKPEDIPVEVILDNVAIKATKQDESDDIVRPVVDLRNPGPPQRQEHETQNPEFYAAEQQIVQMYKQNINDAQNTLQAGLKSVSENVQSMLQNNEQVNLIQQNIQTLRENFVAQINKLNSTIHGYLNADNSNTVSAAEKQIKANVHVAETGLTALKNDFNRGVQALTERLEGFASLRADNENNNPAPAPANPPPAGLPNFTQLITSLQDRFQSGFANFTTTVSQGFGNLFNQTNLATPAASVPAGAQADTPAQPPANNIWSNFQNSMTQSFQSLVTQFQTLMNGGNSNSTPRPASAAQPEEPSKPAETSASPSDDKKPEQTVQPASQAPTIIPDGPIRQILQNNPISQGIANAVHRLQNINNPDKPRETEKEKPSEMEKEKLSEEPAKTDDESKGHPPPVSKYTTITVYMYMILF